MKYDFLVLSILTWIPAVTLLILRPDLKKISLPLCGFSLPFAFAEMLFYPHYWEPYFIGDLGNKLGFGLEDFIFVTGLAAFTSIVYPVLHRKTVDSSKIGWARTAILGLFGSCTLGGLLLAHVPILYATFAVTGLLTVRMVYLRQDLLVPAGLGGCWSTLLYFGICLVFGQIYPGTFETTWHTQGYLNTFILGVPVEELLYGGLCGAAATVFYPFITKGRFRPAGGIYLGRDDQALWGPVALTSRINRR